MDPWEPRDDENPYAAGAEVAWPPPRPAERPRRRVVLPLVLFFATCYTTYRVGSAEYGPVGGLEYAAAVLLILGAHELGHFFQTIRYRVSASFPYFIPMPAGPFGTLGAVIGMRAHEGDRRALFDIAITGPLAGLVPALICCALGLRFSEIVVQGGIPRDEHVLGAPLLFRWLVEVIHGPLPAGSFIELHPIAFAGWVGLFITALNLFPMSQLDGGHILYALFRKFAHPVAVTILGLCVFAVVWFQLWHWTVMLVLVMMMGPDHPPTANDEVPLGWGRTVLGWLAILFVPFGFTPTPF